MVKKSKPKSKRRLTILKEMFKATGDMTYKDLKRNVVVRGMPFDDVINGSFPSLQNWLWNNRTSEIIADLLDQYDDYMDEKLIAGGNEDLVHPQLRLGYIGERDDDGKVTKTKRVKGIKKIRKKKEKTKDGIFTGTKKALTFELQQEGYTIEETKKEVLKQFPEASEKSIKIWYKKCARLHA